MVWSFVRCPGVSIYIFASYSSLFLMQCTHRIKLRLIPKYIRESSTLWQASMKTTMRWGDVLHNDLITNLLFISALVISSSDWKQSWLFSLTDSLIAVTVVIWSGWWTNTRCCGRPIFHTNLTTMTAFWSFPSAIVAVRSLRSRRG